jgi:hypothetical protein
MQCSDGLSHHAHLASIAFKSSGSCMVGPLATATAGIQWGGVAMLAPIAEADEPSVDTDSIQMGSDVYGDVSGVQSLATVSAGVGVGPTSGTASPLRQQATSQRVVGLLAPSRVAAPVAGQPGSKLHSNAFQAASYMDPEQMMVRGCACVEQSPRAHRERRC